MKVIVVLILLSLTLPSHAQDAIVVSPNHSLALEIKSATDGELDLGKNFACFLTKIPGAVADAPTLSKPKPDETSAVEPAASSSEDGEEEDETPPGPTSAPSAKGGGSSSNSSNGSEQKIARKGDGQTSVCSVEQNQASGTWTLRATRGTCSAGCMYLIKR